MLGRDHPLIPVLNQPVAKLIEFIAFLLKDMQEKLGPQKGVSGHDKNECHQQGVNKRKIPAQANVFIGVNIVSAERSLKYLSSVIFETYILKLVNLSSKVVQIYEINYPYGRSRYAGSSTFPYYPQALASRSRYHDC